MSPFFSNDDGRHSPSGYEPWGARQSLWQRVKKVLGPVAVALILIVKFFAKLKFVILPVLKFFPLVLKTGGTMVLSVGAYALMWGWKFAVGFVLLLLVHECGHLLAARRVGVHVGAPVFIPFMGAFIAMKEAPRDAWIEAQIGIGGPLLGTVGAVACWVVYAVTGHQLYAALAYCGFLLNLFNLIPIGFLDGGRVIAAISFWFWVVGVAIVVALMVMHPNVVLLFVVLASAPHMWRCFKERKTAYYQVALTRRIGMTCLYFGLMAFLALGMVFAHVKMAGG